MMKTHDDDNHRVEDLRRQ